MKKGKTRKKAKNHQVQFMIYTSLLPTLRKIARKHGYALAVHGSGQRDFDLIAFPWIETVSRPAKVVNEIAARLGLMPRKDWERRAHGRLVCTLLCGSDLYIDLSFFVKSGNVVTITYWDKGGDYEIKTDPGDQGK